MVAHRARQSADDAFSRVLSAGSNPVTPTGIATSCENMLFYACSMASLFSFATSTLVASGSTALAAEDLGGDIFGVETFRFTASDVQASLGQGDYYISITPEDSE